MSLKIELPEILDDTHPIAHLITVHDKEGRVLSRIKSLNTKTLEAKMYKTASTLKFCKVEKDENGDFKYENVQLEDITIKIIGKYGNT